jgi:transketolase
VQRSTGRACRCKVVMKMIIGQGKELVLEDVMMRDIYCETLLDLAARDQRIVVLDADLMKSMGIIAFFRAYPERTFNCGVQEADMMGIAAGLSATGKVPFAHSFATFATRRCFDQIFLSAAYAQLNVRIIGSDPGITASFNGGTHMAFEDMGMMRSVPGMTVIEPVDNSMLRAILTDIVNPFGLYYIRLLRKHAVKIYPEGFPFEIGKAVTLREGEDVAIIATGILVSEALQAADILSSRGISARVVNMFTLKPIDQEAIIACAAETGAIVTAENHNIINGLGSAVAEVLAENCPVPMERVGILDRFGKVGPVDYLKEEFGLTADTIAGKAEKVLARKKR